MSKYIKIFEAWKNKKKDVVDNDSLIKMKKEWQSIEDACPWEFDYFFDKIIKYLTETDKFYDDNFSDFTECGISSPPWHYLQGMGSVENDYLSGENGKDVDVAKRSCFIYIKINTGGSSGGSCYDDGDDPGSQPYDTGNYPESNYIMSYLKHILSDIFGSNNLLVNVDEISKDIAFSQIAKGLSSTSYEYYGNYDSYQGYYVTLWDIYVYLAKNDIF